MFSRITCKFQDGFCNCTARSPFAMTVCLIFCECLRAFIATRSRAKIFARRKSTWHLRHNTSSHRLAILCAECLARKSFSCSRGVRIDIPLRFSSRVAKSLAFESGFDHKLAAFALVWCGLEVPAGAGRPAVHVFHQDEDRFGLKSLTTMQDSSVGKSR